MDLEIESFAFRLSSLFTTTERHQSVCPSPAPFCQLSDLTREQDPEILELLRLRQQLIPNPEGKQSTVFRQRTVAPDFDLCDLNSIHQFNENEEMCRRIECNSPTHFSLP